MPINETIWKQKGIPISRSFWLLNAGRSQEEVCKLLAPSWW
jgi:hypothetical protein